MLRQIDGGHGVIDLVVGSWREDTLTVGRVRDVTSFSESDDVDGLGDAVLKGLISELVSRPKAAPIVTVS